MSTSYSVGSLSSVSINRRLALALEKLAELPFYSQNYEAPDAATEYRDAVSKADGILIVTPEYNRSIPGVLNNALD
ncbi:NADPH-dependent FMN reductase [Streptomyces sp. NPDC060209]|uniref:NADPH-dependent FMN reductase n=1 Tax=Streptomyces sp. NPDC060209 TaxID=3347073 RepID=UPI0036581297